jgi:hypothetical protein
MTGHGKVQSPAICAPASEVVYVTLFVIIE